jgi:hypothetical protein
MGRGGQKDQQKIATESNKPLLTPSNLLRYAAILGRRHSHPYLAAWGFCLRFLDPPRGKIADAPPTSKS